MRERDEAGGEHSKEDPQSLEQENKTGCGEKK